MASAIQPFEEPEYPALPQKALLYIHGTALLGAVVLIHSLVNWASDDLLKYAAFLFIALLSSGTRIAVPGVRATLPAAQLFVLFGIVSFTRSEVVLLGGLTALMGCYWNQPRRPRPASAIFGVCVMIIAAAAAQVAYHSDWLVSDRIEPAVRIAVATLLLFILYTGPTALVGALSEERNAWAAWRESYSRSLPYYLGGAAVAQLASFANGLFGWQTVLLSGPVVYLIYRAYRLYMQRLQDEKKHAAEMSALHLRTIEALALAIEAKDHVTHDHLHRVQVYAIEMARELDLPPEETEALRAAALLHDVGKLAVPEHIISKPGRLTPEEFEKMKIHPLVGAEILERVQFPYPVAPIVRAHHEKWDGTGYPCGLAGDNIPMGARIIAAVDCLDALASERQYRRALPLEEAMQVVCSEAGKAFDPRIVAILSKRYVEWEAMAHREHPPERPSTPINVGRGGAPAAGFESSSRQDGDARKSPPMDFLSSIAAARQEVQTLFEISQDLGNSLSLDETLSVLAVRLGRIIPHDSLAIWIREGRVLLPAYVSGEEFRLFSSLEIPVGQGLSGWVVENRKAILNGNPSVEPGYLNDPAKFSTLRSAVGVPLEGTNGVTGVLSLYHHDADAFTKDHLRILLAISAKIAVAIENALRFRQVESSATTDFLTGLPNARSLFLHLDGELSRAKRATQPLAVLVADLDGFKQINDRFGHLEANKLLKAVAAGFKSVCREYDYVARMGGDEFVVLLPGAGPLDAANKVKHLQDVVVRVCRELVDEAVLTASIGMAHFPADGTDAEQLLADADRRMYKEKRARKRTPSAPALRMPAAWSTTVQ